ncbi:hypothetical protein [Leucobacter sp. L43]|uniref:hypothetical protein n=1 Tax=Leucobacter sp. L43 TaxID=2798040 RepID=UPI001906166D|nr:hypothetical protein [Leucobacter sp. L43]
MSISAISEIVLRSEDPLKTAAFLTSFGTAVEWLPPIPLDQARRWYGADRELQQLRVATPATRGAVRVLESITPLRRLRPFTEGGYGIDFYTSDVQFASHTVARRGHLPAPPLAWFEEKEELIEARLEDPTGTYAVFLPQMDQVSRLHPSLIDITPNRLYSELCMTSWIIKREDREAERDFWGEQLGLRSVIDTDMDATDMGTLMGHVPAPLHSMQFALDGSPCLIDLLSYELGQVTSADPQTSAISAIVLDTSPDMAAKISGGEVPEEANRGRGREKVVRTQSPSGIPLELWSTR